MRRRTVFLVALVVVLALLNLPFPASLRLRASSRDNLAPFHSGFRALLNYSGRARNAFSKHRGELAEADRLREALAQARFDLARMDSLEQENATLRRLLDVRRRSRYRLTLCQTLSRGGMGGWWQTLRIDKGRRHGIGENMAVVDEQGLVGRTGGGALSQSGPGLVVSLNSSDVLLITDPGSKIACMVGESGYFGILRGKGTVFPFETELDLLAQPAAFEVEYISRNAHIRDGDEVVTSGIGGTIPPGIRVGFVRHVERDSSGLYLRAIVQPVANLRNPQHLFVVVGEGPGEESLVENGGRP